jgi:hypothetical protein
MPPSFTLFLSVSAPMPAFSLFIHCFSLIVHCSSLFALCSLLSALRSSLPLAIHAAVCYLKLWNLSF